MKRKSPSSDSEGRESKRRRLDTTTPYTPRDGANPNDTEVDSPLNDITNGISGISPKPAALHRKTLHNKQMMAQQKSITLTDHEDNIIMEEDEECMDPFADENEVEIARGRNRNQSRSRKQRESAMGTFQDDPFIIPEDPEPPAKPQQELQDIFETIPGIVPYSNYSHILSPHFT